MIEVVYAQGADASAIALMNTRLTPVLLLTGVIITAFLVVRIENALAISISVLIIGTVVAGDRFLLSITALLTDNGGEAGTFVRDIYASQPNGQFTSLSDPGNLETFAAEIVRAIEETQSKELGEDAAVGVVQEYISRARVSQLASDVTSNGAQQPMLVLLRPTDDAAAFFQLNQANGVLRDQMLYLRQNGLVSFSLLDYSDAALTEIGLEVATALNRPFEVIETPIVVEDPMIEDFFDTIDPDNLETIALGTQEVAVPLEWTDQAGWFIALDVSERDIFVFETTDPGPADLDTILTLFTNEGEVLDINDDDGTNALSRVTAELDVGRYVLNVREFGGGGGRVSVRMRN
ncbi:hypothetical protein [Loktanella sp. Alg231-35]|uniref:hypothetical protein n=1 Tax=Loktanella sp. Alg231-35 TaxID=1922220 RepID=UPI00131F167B|nr:hypothetical protein [Loktanella sp. Alg231-35]